MALGLIGKKLGMTSIFMESGEMLPVTVIEMEPSRVIQIKTEEKEGYNALQLGYERKKEKQTLLPLLGHYRRIKVDPCKILKEFRVAKTSDYKEGQEITSEIFEVGETVDVKGISKGRGFTGVMKRHGFKGSKKSHGTHEYFRHGGSIGAAAFPARTWKGTGMPGRSGRKNVTVKNLKIVRVEAGKGRLLIQGAVPGHNGNYVTVIKKS